MDDQLIEEFADLIAEVTGYDADVIADRLRARAAHVASEESQAAIARADAKRQRKAAKLAKQQGAS